MLSHPRTHARILGSFYSGKDPYDNSVHSCSVLLLHARTHARTHPRILGSFYSGKDPYDNSVHFQGMFATPDDPNGLTGVPGSEFTVYNSATGSRDRMELYFAMWLSFLGNDGQQLTNDQLMMQVLYTTHAHSHFCKNHSVCIQTAIFLEWYISKGNCKVHLVAEWLKYNISQNKVYRRKYDFVFSARKVTTKKL